jgi:UDP-hydrolysing UDP-N-acetyl-D-glucosamine 2-epimerase
MATTLAAAYMNIPIAHSMGGEVSGTIDESIRHAVTKFAHIHFPASKGAAIRIAKLGERDEDIHLVGCPRMDLVAEILAAPHNVGNQIFQEGVGASVDIDQPFVMVSQHPVTTEYGAGEAQIFETLTAVHKTGLPAIILWPNSDAGSEDISRGIRKWRELGLSNRMHYFKNLPTAIYIQLMAKTACLVGNSSSGIREGAFIGTPVVNIGSRQDMRERGSNVVDADHKAKHIYDSIMGQLKHGPYEHEPIYGDGSAGKRIANILSTCSWKIQKRIVY